MIYIAKCRHKYDNGIAVYDLMFTSPVEGDRNEYYKTFGCSSELGKNKVKKEVKELVTGKIDAIVVIKN